MGAMGVMGVMDIDKTPLLQQIVQTTALSCLLVIDFVNGKRAPPIKEMVQNELPRVLSTLMRVQNFGIDLEHDLKAPWCSDPKGLLDRVMSLVKDDTLQECITALQEYGHHDMVFASLMYTRKPPVSMEEDIPIMSEHVADILGVELRDETTQGLLQSYVNIHTQLVQR